MTSFRRQREDMVQPRLVERGVEDARVPDAMRTVPRERLGALGYDNIEIRQGDGTLGWPAQAPFDAILVSAGGPDVPPTLLEQLAVGGRMVIPVGDRTRSQELLRITRLDEHQYSQDSLGRVQFVPLVGSEAGKPARPSIRRRRRDPGFR